MSRSQHADKPRKVSPEDRPQTSSSLESLRHLLGPDAGKIERGIVFTTTAKDEWLGHMGAKNDAHHEHGRSDEFYDQNHKCIRRGQYAPKPYVPYLNEWMRNASDSDRLIMEKFIASLSMYNKTAASKPKQPLRFNHEGGYRRKYRELHTWLTREEQDCSPPPQPPDTPDEQKSELRKETPSPRRDEAKPVQNEISATDPTTNSFFQTIQKPAVSFKERSGDRRTDYNKKYEKNRPDTAPPELMTQVQHVERPTHPRPSEARAENMESSCPPNPLYPNRRTKSCLPNRPSEEKKLQAHIMTNTGVKMQKKFVHKKLQGRHVPSDQDLVPVPKTYTRTYSAPLGQTRTNAKKRSTMVYNHNTKPCDHKCHNCGVDVSDLPKHMVRCQAERIIQNRHTRSKSCPMYIPEVYDFEHKATNFEEVKRHVVGNRGHFTIHPQFVSENSLAPHMVSSKEWKAMH